MQEDYPSYFPYSRFTHGPYDDREADYDGCQSRMRSKAEDLGPTEIRQALCDSKRDWPLVSNRALTLEKFKSIRNTCTKWCAEDYVSDPLRHMLLLLCTMQQVW